MEPDKIYNEISNLPPEARQQVVDFIFFLKTRLRKSQKAALKKNIVDDPFIGIWKDRADMKDSRKWLRNIRESEWGGTS